jgi:glucose-6-phosphate isomerase
MMAMGPEDFADFLAGAHGMDRHFREPVGANLPCCWRCWGSGTLDLRASQRAIIPYDQRLSRLPAYLQQLEMESNGKSGDGRQDRVENASGPLSGASPAPTGSTRSSSCSTRARDVILASSWWRPRP